MPNVNNVSYGKPKVSGAVYRAPAGTELPTDAKTVLHETYKGLGYISEDGLTNGNATESENVKAWGGDVVLVSQTGRDDTFKMKLIESLNVEVLKTIYGDANVTGDLATGISVNVNAKELDESVWVIDIAMKGGHYKRIVIPKGKITAFADVVYKDKEAVGYELTLAAIADTEKNSHYEYIVKGESENA